MKNKIIRILLSVLFVIIFLLYIGPVITVGEYNLGIIAGLGFDFILLIYIIFFNKINLLIKNINKKKIGKIALKIISFVLFICIIIGGTTFHNVLSRSFKSEEKSDVAIVLGCVVNGDKPGIFLKGRINAAYKYLNENPNAIAVLSGGQGNGENISEAKCMFNCLTEMGIDKNRLLIEDKSTSTRENFKYSKEIIEKNGIKSKKITIITNDFHECRASEFAKQNGYAAVLDGTNADDHKSYRPGIRAIRELGVISPLSDQGLTKQEIRALAAQMGLSCATKPATPCLATRIPYNTPLEPQTLQKIEAGEEILHQAGFASCRLRVHGVLARIEVEPEKLEQLIEQREIISREILALGFSFVTLDLQGLRSGCYDQVEKLI